MGQYFEIEDEDRVVIAGYFDDMLNEFGKPCKLAYQSTESACPNCIINPRTGESMNIYKPGGPVPFDDGEICPVCDGRGRVAGTATSDLITMTIDWTPKSWMNIGSAAQDKVVRIPAGMVTTRGFAVDVPKVLRADTVLLDITNQYITNRYKLYGQPFIVGPLSNNRYFIAVWEKT